jgi:hypothetical protein
MAVADVRTERRALALAALSIIMAVGWVLYRYVVE